MRRARSGAARLLALLALLAHPARADDAPVVDALYMEPNEGGASAGHVALAFDDRSFAFQRSPEGWLVLERDASEHLTYLYAVLGNRAVHRSRVAVSAETYERLREGFNRRYLIQQRQLALLDGLAAERRLLAALVRHAKGEGTDGIPVEAAGFFGSAAPESAAVAVLRRAVEAAHGAGFVARRLAAARAALASLVPDDSALPPPALDIDAYPPELDRFATRYAAALGAVVALETLRDAPGLDPAALVTVGDRALDDDETRALADHGARLRQSLVRLAASGRADVGTALLIGMARLAAVERSLAAGVLVVLDAFPARARRVPHAAIARTIAVTTELRAEADADLARIRRAFAAAREPGERDYTDLETAANRAAELARGVTEARDVRVATDTMVPSRAALRTDLVLPAIPPARLVAAADAAARTADAYAAAFTALYRYDLVRRNCATEMFRTVDAVLGEDAAHLLGGRLAGDGGGRFIPSLARRAVRRTWRVVASDTTPSYRQARVAALARDGNPFLVRLRESNTLTSTIYRRSSDDSTFLFFTDDVLPLRPLLGAANLAVGVGASVVGVAQAPLDRGAGLSAGLRGILWSVPELFFLNVRKGSFDHVARTDVPE